MTPRKKTAGRLTALASVLAALAWLLHLADVGFDPELIAPTLPLAAALVGFGVVVADAERHRTVTLAAGIMTAAYSVVFAPIGGVLFLPSAVCLLLAGRGADRS